MEVPSLQGIKIESGLLTMEKRARVGERKQSLRIGIPGEISNEERRVSISPSGVGTLVANGHEVAVERGAGNGANFADSEYSEAGAEILDSVSELYARSNLIVKVGPPNRDELGYLQEVSEIFAFSEKQFEQIAAQHMVSDDGLDPYLVLGVDPDMDDAAIKKAYRAHVSELHPDRLMANGVPAELVTMATAKLAAINEAYDILAKTRKL